MDCGLRILRSRSGLPVAHPSLVRTNSDDFRPCLSRHGSCEPSGMTPREFERRTRALGVQVIRMVCRLDQGVAVRVCSYQLIKCATSMGANYRAACRARSRREFIAKLGVVEEEADEMVFWLEVMVEADLITSAAASKLMTEAHEILAMTVASIKTARRKLIEERRRKKAQRRMGNPQSAIRNPQFSMAFPSPPAAASALRPTIRALPRSDRNDGWRQE